MGVFSKIGEFLAGPIMGPINKVLETRHAKKVAEAEVMVDIAKAEAQVKIAKLKSEAVIAEKKATADVDWERIWATQAEKSWKDEYWTLMLSAPVIMAFIPFLQSYAIEGFTIIDQMPQWYITALLSAIGAAFGLRALTKFKRKDKNGNQ